MSATASSNPYRAPEADLSLGSGVTTELAERGTRLAATILDNLIMFGFLLPGILVFALGADGSTGASSDAMVAGGSIAIVVGLAVWAIITFRLVMQNGWTLGKRACGIRVVRSSGMPASVSRIFFLRNVVIQLIASVPLVGPIFALVDILYIFTEDRRCLHDLIADTIVVRA